MRFDADGISINDGMMMMEMAATEAVGAMVAIGAVCWYDIFSPSRLHSRGMLPRSTPAGGAARSASSRSRLPPLVHQPLAHTHTRTPACGRTCLRARFARTPPAIAKPPGFLAAPTCRLVGKILGGDDNHSGAAPGGGGGGGGGRKLKVRLIGVSRSP